MSDRVSGPNAGDDSKESNDLRKAVHDSQEVALAARKAKLLAAETELARLKLAKGGSTAARVEAHAKLDAALAQFGRDKSTPLSVQALAAAKVPVPEPTLPEPYNYVRDGNLNELMPILRDAKLTAEATGVNPINHRDGRGYTLLDQAVVSQQPKVVQAILDTVPGVDISKSIRLVEKGDGASKEVATLIRNRQMFDAIESGDSKMFKEALVGGYMNHDMGADPNAQKDGKSALILAAEKGRLDMVEGLLARTDMNQQKGVKIADFDAVDGNGDNALAVARKMAEKNPKDKKRYDEVANLLSAWEEKRDEKLAQAVKDNDVKVIQAAYKDGVLTVGSATYKRIFAQARENPNGGEMVAVLTAQQEFDGGLQAKKPTGITYDAPAKTADAGDARTNKLGKKKPAKRNYDDDTLALADGTDTPPGAGAPAPKKGGGMGGWLMPLLAGGAALGIGSLLGGGLGIIPLILGVVAAIATFAVMNPSPPAPDDQVKPDATPGNKKPAASEAPRVAMNMDPEVPTNIPKMGSAEERARQ